MRVAGDNWNISILQKILRFHISPYQSSGFILHSWCLICSRAFSKMLNKATWCNCNCTTNVSGENYKISNQVLPTIVLSNCSFSDFVIVWKCDNLSLDLEQTQRFIVTIVPIDFNEDCECPPAFRDRWAWWAWICQRSWMTCSAETASWRQQSPSARFGRSSRSSPRA